MKTVRTCKVELSQLKTNLFVRRLLDQDHVLLLADLLEGGKELPPIEVTEEMNVVDGRHRREAYEFLDIKEVSVKVLRFDDEAEMISYAFKSNCGGSKPPTPDDIDHTIELLLERESGQKAIAEGLNLPLKMVRKYIDDVRSRLARAKLMKAVDSILTGGLSVAKAAEQYGVDIDKLKEHLSGKKKKHPGGIESNQKTITYNYKSISSKNAALCSRLSDQYDDGDVTRTQVLEILDHIADLQKKGIRTTSEWRSRFEAKFGENGKKK